MKVWLEGCLGLLRLDARLHPAEDLQPPATAVIEIVPLRRHLRFHHHRHAHARRVSDIDAIEARLRHPDNREWIVVHDDRCSDDTGVGAKARSPVPRS